MTLQPQEAKTTICLYRRSTGRAWWRVDASITPAGDVHIVSGDASEWHATVRSDHLPALLRALRRMGNLTASIGSSQEDEILTRLHELFFRSEDQAPPFEDIKTFLRAEHIPWEPTFWAGDSEDGAPLGPSDAEQAVRHVLARTRDVINRTGNDFTWSSWIDAADATEEIDGLIRSLASGHVDHIAAALSLLFAPAGAVQELALASGWAHDFKQLADAADACLPQISGKR